MMNHRMFFMLQRGYHRGGGDQLVYIQQKQVGEKHVIILIAICQAWLIFKDRHTSLAALPAIMFENPCNLRADGDVVNTRTHVFKQDAPCAFYVPYQLFQLIHFGLRLQRWAHHRQYVRYAPLHCNCGQKLKREEEESSLCSIGKITECIPPVGDRFPVRVPRVNKATVRGQLKGFIDPC